MLRLPGVWGPPSIPHHTPECYERPVERAGEVEVRGREGVPGAEGDVVEVHCRPNNGQVVGVLHGDLGGGRKERRRGGGRKERRRVRRGGGRKEGRRGRRGGGRKEGRRGRRGGGRKERRRGRRGGGRKERRRGRREVTCTLPLRT